MEDKKVYWDNRNDMRSVCRNGGCFGDLRISSNGIKVTIPARLLNKPVYVNHRLISMTGRIPNDVRELMHGIRNDDLVKRLEDHGIIVEIMDNANKEAVK